MLKIGQLNNCRFLIQQKEQIRLQRQEKFSKNKVQRVIATGIPAMPAMK